MAALTLILKVRFQNFQNKSPLIQRGEDRTLGKFCDPLVSSRYKGYHKLCGHSVEPTRRQCPL